MIQIRTSQLSEVPRLKELWKLAFGDEDRYIDHFFRQYYRPERVLVLLEDGVVQAMTAWFDTDFADTYLRVWRAAYLYAVATHPDCRGRGFAGRLLAWADDYLYREQGFDCVTTVPARPDLHAFFGRNGFQEYFQIYRRELTAEEVPEAQPYDRVTFQPVSARQYGQVRERLLSGRSHVIYSQDALEYQEGCCRLSGGGLFWVKYPFGDACLCVERAGDDLVVVKELLGFRSARYAVCRNLSLAFPARRWQVRELVGAPDFDDAPVRERLDFAMLKWLEPRLREEWKPELWSYLGLAFD